MIAIGPVAIGPVDDGKGLCGGSDDYRTNTYCGMGVDVMYQVRKRPPGLARMLALTDHIHRPRVFAAYGLYQAFLEDGRDLYHYPILFIGDLQTASGQSLFAVIELQTIEHRPGQLQLEFRGPPMRLDHETCEYVFNSSRNDLKFTSEAAENETDWYKVDNYEKVELKMYKRAKGQKHPRFHVRWGEEVHVYEIHLEIEDDADAPQYSAKITFVKIKTI